MPTKLAEWAAGALLIAAVWAGLASGRLGPEGLRRDHPVLVWIWPVFPVAMFGLFSVAVILKRVYEFNDCEDAAAELQRQIKEAKADLLAKGLKVD